MNWRLQSAEYRLYRGQQALVAMSGRFSPLTATLIWLFGQLRSVFRSAHAPLQIKATGNSRSGIPGNSRESATPKIPGGNSRELYWVLDESFWEFIKYLQLILVISCCELWNLADMKTHFPLLFEFKSLNRA